MHPRLLRLVYTLGTACIVTSCGATDPHTALCERATSCFDVTALLDANECAAQLRASLVGCSSRCRDCVLHLNCLGLERAVSRAGGSGSSDVRNVCAECDPRASEDPTQAPRVGDSSPSFTLRGITLRHGAGSSVSAAQHFCDEMNICTELELLMSSAQCAEQLEGLLAHQQTRCASCVTNLNCHGVEGIVRGSARLDQLCPGCPRSLLDESDAEAREPSTTNTLIPALRLEQNSQSNLSTLIQHSGLTSAPAAKPASSAGKSP